MPVTDKARSTTVIPLLLLMLLLLVAPLQADELILKDGSRLLGEVIRQKDGVLEFKTGYAGVINVQWSQVSEMQTDRPVEVLLDSKESLRATSIRTCDDATYIEATALPVRVVTPQDLASINPEPWERGDGYKLSGLVNAGLDFQQGNSDQKRFALDGAVKVRRQHDRLNTVAQYQRDESNSITSAENWFLRNKYDHFETEKRYYGGSLNFEHDRFSDLKLRTALGPHVGYQFFESRQTNLSVDVSLMYVMDEYYTAPDEEYAALGWNIDFENLLLADRIKFYHRQSGLIEPGKADDAVIDTWTGFRFPLVAGILASLEAQVDYDGGAPAGFDRVDTIYRAKLGYQW